MFNYSNILRSKKIYTATFSAIVFSSLFSVPTTSYFWGAQYQPLFFQATVFLTSLYIIAKSIKRDLKVRVTKIDLLILLFIAYCWFNTVLRYNNFTLRNANLMMFAYLALYFLLKFFINRKGQLKNMLYVAIAYGVINSIIGFLQVTGLYPIIYTPFIMTGAFNNPAQLAGFLVGILPLVFILKPKSRRLDLLFWVIILLFLTVIIVTGSRAAILSSIVIFIFYLLVNVELTVGKWLWITVIVAFFGLTYLLYQLKVPSANGRLLIWKISFAMFKEAPILGHGGGAVLQGYNCYQADYFAKGLGTSGEKILARNSSYLFNEPLQLLTEQGITGFLLALLVIYEIFKRQKNALSKATSCAYFSLISIFVFGLFSYPSDTIAINIILLIGLASVSITRPVFHLKNDHKIIPWCFGIIVMFFCNVKIVNAILNTWHWEIADHLCRDNEIEAFIRYKKTAPYLRYNPFFMQNYFSQLVNLHYYQEALDLFHKNKDRFIHSSDLHIQLGYCFEKKSNFPQAEREYKISSNITPGLLIPKYYLLKLYISTAQHDNAASMAKVIIKSPVIIQNQKSIQIRREASLFLHYIKSD